MEVDPNEYTIRDLRDWLRQLNLPMSGNKSALILRLNNVPAEQRGTCPIRETEEDEFHSDEVDSEQSESGKADNYEVALLKRELALVEKEKSLLKRENDLLKQQVNNKQSDIQPLRPDKDFNFTTIKDFLPEYDGNGNVELWLAQLQNLCKNFKLTDESMKALLICKVKGAAQNWLHAKSNYISMDINVLLSEFNSAFKIPGSKLAQRRKFESRKWVQNERFSDYFNEKLKLAANLQFDETELVEHIVEGISNYQLRTQATIQCFSGPDDLLRAFANIELPKTSSNIRTLPAATTTKSNTRCFNCNSLGHFASECRKPKRDIGTCYGCGSKEHMLPACPLRKGVHLIHDIQEAQ